MSIFEEPGVKTKVEWAKNCLDDAMEIYSSEKDKSSLDLESVRCSILCAISYLNDANRQILKERGF